MNPESEVGQLPNNSPIVQQEHQSRAGSLDSKAQDTERRLSAPEVQNARDNLLNALPLCPGRHQAGDQWITVVIG